MCSPQVNQREPVKRGVGWCHPLNSSFWVKVKELTVAPKSLHDTAHSFSDNPPSGSPPWFPLLRSPIAFLFFPEHVRQPSPLDLCKACSLNLECSLPKSNCDLAPCCFQEFLQCPLLREIFPNHSDKNYNLAYPSPLIYSSFFPSPLGPFNILWNSLCFLSSLVSLH